MPNEPATVPAWMKSTGVKIGNIDSSDLKPPRLKLLAGMSPEVIDGMPGAQPGKFWMTILNLNLGDSVTGSLILLRKLYHVWQPRGWSLISGGVGSSLLATAPDGNRWEQPNQEFELRPPGSKETYIWRIGTLVTDYDAHKFGTSQPEDPRSRPIATLTYDMLWAIDLPDGKKQQCVFTASRTGVTPTQNFISTVMSSGVDQFYQRHKIVVKKKTGPTMDPYFTFDFLSLGNIQDEEEGLAMRKLYEQYSRTGFVVDLDAEEKPRPAPARAAPAADDDDPIPF